MAGAIGPTTTGLAMVGFITGLDADGTLNAQNGWSWDGNAASPHYAAANGSAHSWGRGATVTYGLDTSVAWSASEARAVRQTLSLWSAVANVTFTQTAYTTAKVKLTRPATGGSDASSSYRTGAVGSASVPTTTAGLVDLSRDTGYGQIDSFSVLGGYGPSVVLHETGHALGLMHSGAYNGTVQPGHDQFAPEDTMKGSVMSYLTPWDATARYFQPGTTWRATDGAVHYAETPMQYDILAIQRLYGAPVSTPLSGGQVFGFHNSTGLDAYDFTLDRHPVVTLWDAGLGNTLDLSGFSAPSIVDLNPGAFSSTDGMTSNIAIAFGTRIDSAVGGSGNDSFTLNLFNDTIDGGAGSNTAVMPGRLGEYSFGFAGGAVTAVAEAAGAGGTSVLRQIQQLRFADGATVAATALPHRIDYTDATTHVGGVSDAAAYAGPVSYLRWEYIWSSPDAAVLRANAPSTFLKGGALGDALLAGNGSNVLDGGLGSNFLVGGTGADGGVDTFFVDARGGGVAWSTAVNFHPGDMATIWGFVSGVSTYTWAANEGAAGYEGATLHAATSGQGPADTSFTFAGMSLEEAQARVVMTTGVVGGNAYAMLTFAS